MNRLHFVLIPLLWIHGTASARERGHPSDVPSTSVPPLAANVQFSAHLNGPNAIPPNQSPLDGFAALWFGNPYRQAGVSNVLTFAVEVGFSTPRDDSAIQPGNPIFQDEAGNAITNLSSYAPPPGVLPGPIFIPTDLRTPLFPPVFIFSIQQFALTPEQAKDLFAGRWFLSVGVFTPSGDAYPQWDIRGRVVLADSDEDGVPDYLDKCPGTVIGAAVDQNGCSIEQLCPCNGRWNSHGDYVNCVGQTAAQFQKDGLITAEQKRATVQHAANSDCGRRLTPEAPNSGIVGQSVINGCPVSFQDEICTFPFPTSLKVFTASGSLITEIKTDTQGQFHVSLKPGDYILVPWVPSPAPAPPGVIPPSILYPYAGPLTVTVPFKEFINVVIGYQSGIE